MFPGANALPTTTLTVTNVNLNDEINCPPILRDEVAKRNNWVRPVGSTLITSVGVPPGADPDYVFSGTPPWYVDAFYMPKLSWETVTVARGSGEFDYFSTWEENWDGKGSGDPSDDGLVNCDDPVQVRVNSIASQGAGSGVIVIRKDNLCETTWNSKKRACDLFIGTKRYNLLKSADRDKIRCKNFAWIPNGSSPVQIVSRNQPINADPEAQTDGDPWRGDRWTPKKKVWAGNYRNDWCIPVPAKQGKYPLTVIISAQKQTIKGEGAYFSCNWSGYVVRCGNYFDADFTVDDSYQYSYGVIVKANSVQVTKNPQ